MYSLINTAYSAFLFTNTTITNNIRNGRHTQRSDDDLNFEVVVAEKDRKSLMKLTLKYILSKASSKTKMK